MRGLPLHGQSRLPRLPSFYVPEVPAWVALAGLLPVGLGVIGAAEWAATEYFGRAASWLARQTFGSTFDNLLAGNFAVGAKTPTKRGRSKERAKTDPGAPRKRARSNGSRSRGDSRSRGVSAGGSVGTGRVRGGGQTGYTSGKYGRPKAFGYGTLLKMTVPKRVVRFGGLNVGDRELDNVCPGYYKMTNTTGDPTAVLGMVPVMVLSLNSTTQNNTPPHIFRQARIESNGRVSWVTMNGVQADGVTPQPSPYIEWANTSALGSTTYSRGYDEWHQIKLKMYGAKAQNTCYYITLVQCSDDLAAVEDEPGLVGATGTHADRYRDTIYGWWQNQIKPLISNRLTSQNNARGHSRPPFKVLRQWTYQIAPENDDEGDKTANSVEATLFIHDHRMLNYQWINSSSAYNSAYPSNGGMDDLIERPNYINTGVAAAATTVFDTPHPRARRYLIIRALNPTAVYGGADEAQYTPSFDMVYRKKQLIGQ